MLDKLVTVTLDKERHLRLTLEGMLAFEKRTGKNLLKGFDLKDFTMEDNAALIWACLIHEDRTLKFGTVLRMVDINNLTPVMSAVMACMNQALPDSEVTSHPLVKKRPRG